MAEAQSNRIKAIFAEALETAVDRRGAFLDQACGNDAALRAEVEALLSAAERAPEFLGSPTRAAHTAIDGTTAREGPGSTIGRYKLLQLIGEGGFGSVFMAEQEFPVRRKVALKIIKLGMDTKQVIARFEAERQALAMMDHPNIAKVFDGGATESGRPYFVMELVRGITITEYCDQHNLAVRQRLELFTQVCQAVQHAHQKGIVHRDLKPSNVLVADYDDRAVPKVIDFGVAKAIGQDLTEKTMFTQFGQIIGSIEYMSPEQAKLNQLDIDTRTDIYSLGVLLYQLLTGETPFDRQRFYSAAFDEILRIIREEEPPKPSTRLSSSQSLASIAAQRQLEPKRLTTLVSGDLDWIVMCCLEKDRKRRYESAASLAADVNHYLADEPVSASPPSATYTMRKFARRHRTALRVTAAFVVLLLAATVFSSFEAVRATHAKADALTQKRRADEQAAVAEGMNQFFSDEVFGLADPKRLDRAGITLVEALNAAASKVDTRFPDDPRLRADIRDRFGEIYIGIDKPQQAVEQLQKAVNLRTALLGVKDPITMRSRCELGWALKQTGRLSEGRDVLEAVLSDQTQVLGAANPDTIQTASYLSETLMEIRGSWGPSSDDPDDRMDLDVPRKAYQQALAALGPRHPATLNAESALSWSLRWRGNTTEALGYAREASTGLAEIRGPDYPDSVWASYNYAACLFETGHPEQAANELQPLVAARYRILGPSHIDTWHTAWRLSMALRIAGRPQESLAVLEQLRAHLEEFQSEHTWQRGETLSDLALCYQALNRFDRAAEFFAASCKMADVLPDQETEQRRYAHWINSLAGDLVNFPVPVMRDVPEGVELATRACELTDYRKADYVNTLYHALTAEGKQAAVSAVYTKALAACRQAILQQPNSGELYLELGGLLEAQQKFPEAAAAFTEATRLAPDVPEIWAASGRGDLQMNELAKMAEDYSEAIKLAPDHQWYWHERAYAYGQLGDNQKALADHTKTIELGDTDFDERLRRGEVYEDLGELSKAEIDYSRAIEIDRGNTRALWVRSRLYRLEGRIDKAEADLASAVEGFASSTNDDDLWHVADEYDSLGALQRDSGRPEEAAKSLQSALAIWTSLASDGLNLDRRSRLTRTQAALADLFRAEKKPAAADVIFRDAEASYRKMIRANPNFPGPYILLGDFLASQQKFTEALATYNEAIRSGPQMPEAWAARGNYYLQMSEFAEMAEDYSEAIKLAPSGQWYWHERGYAYMQLGDNQKALSDHTRTIELGDNDSDERFRRGTVYEGLGQLSKAEADYSRAIEIDPKNDAAWLERGYVYEGLGELSKAEADYSKTIELNPKNNLACYRRAWLYGGLGQYENAIADYTRGIELSPDIAPFWMSRADCWTALGQAQKAAEDRAKASALLNEELKSDPNDVWAPTYLARLLTTTPDEKLRDPKRAVELAEKAVLLAPGEGDIWNTLGIAHYRNGDFKRAIDDLEKSISLRNGGRSADFFFMAMAHYQLGQKDEAAMWQAKAVEWINVHSPKNPQLLGLRAETAELLGMPLPSPASAPASRP